MPREVVSAVAACVGGGEAVGGVVDGAWAAREPVVAPEKCVKGGGDAAAGLAREERDKVALPERVGSVHPHPTRSHVGTRA